MLNINFEKLRILGKSLRNFQSIVNYIGLRIAYRLQLKKVAFIPTQIDIEPANNCNFKCPHCQVTHWDKPKKHLDLAGFQKIVNSLPYLVRIKLQGMGEPLLNKNFIEMLALGESQGISMSFTTNGSLLNPDRVKELAELNNTKIIVSIDSSSKEIFESIRVGSRFPQVKKNVRDLARAFENSKTSNKIMAWMVITEKNFHQAPEVVKLVKDLGVNRLTIQTFLNNWGKEEMNSYTNHSCNFQALDREIAKAKQVAKDVQLNLTIAAHDYIDKNKKCPWLWNSSFIAANGDVVPCCILADADTVKMGNVFEDDFANIWNSPQYQNIRERHKNNDIPDYCKQCYSSHDD